MNHLLDYAAGFAALCFMVAMLFALARLFRGPARAGPRARASTRFTSAALLPAVARHSRALDGVFRPGVADRVVRLRRIHERSAKFLLRGEVIEP